MTMTATSPKSAVTPVTANTTTTNGEPNEAEDVVLIDQDSALPAPDALFPSLSQRQMLEKRYSLHYNVGRTISKPPDLPILSNVPAVDIERGKKAVATVQLASYMLNLSKLERLRRVHDMQTHRQPLEYHRSLKSSIASTSSVRSSITKLQSQIATRKEVLRQVAELDAKADLILKRKSRSQGNEEIAAVETSIDRMKGEERALKRTIDEWALRKEMIKVAVRDMQRFAEVKRSERTEDGEDDRAAAAASGSASALRRRRGDDSVSHTPFPSPRPDLKTPASRRGVAAHTPMSTPKSPSPHEEDGEIQDEEGVVEVVSHTQGKAD